MNIEHLRYVPKGTLNLCAVRHVPGRTEEQELSTGQCNNLSMWNQIRAAQSPLNFCQFRGSALDLHLVLIGKLFRQIYILDLYKYVSIYSNALATNHKSHYIFLRKCKKSIHIVALLFTQHALRLESNQIKSNQITFIVTSPQHKCLGEWNSWERAPNSAKKQNSLHIDSTYLQTVQKTMCKIHIHILNIHSVL